MSCILNHSAHVPKHLLTEPSIHRASGACAAFKPPHGFFRAVGDFASGPNRCDNNLRSWCTRGMATLCVRALGECRVLAVLLDVYVAAECWQEGRQVEQRDKHAEVYLCHFAFVTYEK